ncbi:GNAT family N-acetyltransferase [Marinobacter sp.]|uniref:GNAT family N-acetyltransferase n=1 Tax=Marinobacter sp. TaxID=50741 RepID=UPI00356526D1
MSVFQTDAWQKSWWETWGDTPGFESVTEGAAGANGVYLSHYRFKGFPIHALECVGTSHRCIATPRTEYNTLLGDTPDTNAYDKLMALLSSRKWTETVLSDFRVNSTEYQLLQKITGDKGWLWRLLEEDTAYSVNTTGSFQEYLASLGSNTRLRLYNRRKVLNSLGEVTVRDVPSEDHDSFLSSLDQFHQQRWDSPCFGGEKGMMFQRKFLERLPSEGGKARLSELRLDGRLISVLYNVEYQGRVYNIQGGFADNVHKKLAPGTLHFGYVIEQCFEDSYISVFDMLAGTGKNENYKARIATDEEPMATVMIVRSWLFRLIYRFKG